MLSLAAVVALALAARVIGLGSFMTADEGNWMERSAVFYDELLKGNPGGTYLTSHPGPTAMWLIGGGETLQEWRLGVPVENDTLKHFRKAAILPLVLVLAGLIGLTTWLFARLTTKGAGALAGVLLALEPYLVGSGQIAHLDALQAMLMLPALLAALLSTRERPTRYLLLAGVLSGAALGTKAVLALWLVPFYTAFFVVDARRRRLPLVATMVTRGGLVVGAAAVTFYALWPALWVKDDLGPSLASDVGWAIREEHVALDAGDDPISPATFYIRTVLGRMTPAVLVVAAGGLIVAIIGWWRRQGTVVGWLWLYALGFLALITLAAKKGDRYALPALVVLPVVAGWVLAYAGTVVAKRWPFLRGRARIAWVAFVVLLVGQLAAWVPHAIAYDSPWFPDIRPLSQQGWGEGLDQAAAWLNKHPLAKNLVVASWYRSVMGTYFTGKTFALTAVEDYRVGYVVTYRNMYGRAPDTVASNILDAYAHETPVHTVTIRGKPYAWIYETFGVGNYARHVGEIVAGTEVGQTVEPTVDQWQSIDIGFANFSSRANTVDVILHVRQDLEATEDLRTVVVNAADIADNEWHRFHFAPIGGAAGRTFYVAITSPAGHTGDAVTVHYADADLSPGQMVLLRRPLRPGEKRAASMKPADIAYRIDASSQ